jgi:signal transduction histidine kinase
MNVHYEQFHRIEQRLFGEQADRRLKTLEVVHQVETIRKEVEIYQLKNVALQKEIREREHLIADLDAFAHTVAHDLKNPLSTVIGFAEVLADDFASESRDRLSDEDVQRILRDVIGMGLKMDSIIRELLLLAGVSKLEMTLDALKMSSIVDEAQRRLQWLIEDSHNKIILPEVWPIALGHGPWIEEVWVNYISNAIKYGGDPPVVTLGATVSKDENTVCFWVRDNGVGIPIEQQSRLFTAFSRLDRPRADGHGLGLSIVKRIVEKLGGEVGVESETGQGSTFHFTLPSG